MSNLFSETVKWRTFGAKNGRTIYKIRQNVVFVHLCLGQMDLFIKVLNEVVSWKETTSLQQSIKGYLRSKVLQLNPFTTNPYYKKCVVGFDRIKPNYKGISLVKFLYKT